MNPADEEAVKTVPAEQPSSRAAAGSIDQLDEQLRVSVDDLLHLSHPPKSELDDLLSAISHHLDQEALERKAIHHRLVAIEDEMKGRGLRGFAGYLLAICIGVVAAFAWQSYAEPTKRIIATSAPELGWSPEAKQMIAGWMQQLGWTKPPAVESKAAPVTQTAPEIIAPKAPAAPPIGPGAVSSDSAGCCRAAADRRATHRRSRPDGTRGRKATGRPTRKSLRRSQRLPRSPLPPPRANPPRRTRRRSWRPHLSGRARRLARKQCSRFGSISALKSRRQHMSAMSALPPKADIGTRPRYIRFVPKADIPRYSIVSSARGRLNPTAIRVQS